MKELSRKILKLAEDLFLRAHGWLKIGDDEWTPPKSYGRPEKVGKRYRGGHAVNSQKYTNSMMSRLGREIDDPLDEVKEEG